MTDNVMRKIRIEKVTVHFGAGSDQAKLQKGIELFKMIFGKEPVKTHAKKRIQTWGVRPGLTIGLKLTFRGKEAEEWLDKLLSAKGKILSPHVFDNNGNFAFGVLEYIDIPDVKYNSSLGILGFEVNVTLERAGFRVKKRSIRSAHIPHKHRISKDEAMAFVQEKYGVKYEERSEDDF